MNGFKFIFCCLSICSRVKKISSSEKRFSEIEKKLSFFFIFLFLEENLSIIGANSNFISKGRIKD